MTDTDRTDTDRVDTDKKVETDRVDTDKKVETDKGPEERPGGLRGLAQKFREVTYGMAAHDMTRYALRSRASMEHLFILTTMGDLVGVPILPPYYSLRLLPYVVPQISTWKRRMLREKDLTDAMF